MMFFLFSVLAFFFFLLSLFDIELEKLRSTSVLPQMIHTLRNNGRSLQFEREKELEEEDEIIVYLHSPRHAI